MHRPDYSVYYRMLGLLADAHQNTEYTKTMSWKPSVEVVFSARIHFSQLPIVHRVRRNSDTLKQLITSYVSMGYDVSVTAAEGEKL